MTNLLKLCFSASFIFILVFFNACKPTDETPLTDYSTGVLIVNEGPFQTGTGTISHYNRQNAPVNDIIGLENDNAKLGNIAQSMQIFNGKAYIVVNNANKMIVVDAKTFKNPETISGLNFPNQFLPIDNIRAYISEWGVGGKKGAIRMYDYATKTLSKTILTGGFGAGRMLKIGSYVWVVNNGGNDFKNIDSTVNIIDVDRDSVVNTIKIGTNPNSIVQDANGDIWILCRNKLVKYRNGGIELSFPVPDYSLRLTTDLTKNNLYFIGGDNKIYQKDLLNFGKTAPSVFSTPNYVNAPYALGFDPKTGFMYCGDAENYVSNGTVYIFEPTTKALKDSIKVGISPNSFIFQ